MLPCMPRPTLTARQHHVESMVRNSPQSVTSLLMCAGVGVGEGASGDVPCRASEGRVGKAGADGIKFRVKPQLATVQVLSF